MVDQTCTHNFLPLLPKLKHKVQQYHGLFDKQLDINYMKLFTMQVG